MSEPNGPAVIIVTKEHQAERWNVVLIVSDGSYEVESSIDRALADRMATVARRTIRALQGMRQ